MYSQLLFFGAIFIGIITLVGGNAPIASALFLMAIACQLYAINSNLYDFANLITKMYQSTKEKK